MLSEFKAFIARGNVLDLAVAVIIGAAFATIIASLTDDIIMPVVGCGLRRLDFANYFAVLGPIPDGFKGDPDELRRPEGGRRRGARLGPVHHRAINFLILAFVIFLLVRTANRMLKRGEEAPAGPTEAELLTEIRDELRKRP